MLFSLFVPFVPFVSFVVNALFRVLRDEKNITKMSMNDLIQSVSNPFIETFATGLSSRGNLGMNAGRNAQGQEGAIQFSTVSPFILEK